jgi:MarR family transcriptional regulator, organic hydroperoxide resistance regulator
LPSSKRQDPLAREEAHEIVALVRALRRSVLRGARAELSRSGLTGAQLNVLSLLGTRGALTLSDLSRELELGHSTVSGIVDRLQARSIVQRQPSPADRRYTRISLTGELSRKVPALIVSGPGSRLVAALAAAPSHESHTIREGLALLQRYLSTWTDSTPP